MKCITFSISELNILLLQSNCYLASHFLDWYKVLAIAHSWRCSRITAEDLGILEMLFTSRNAF